MNKEILSKSIKELNSLLISKEITCEELIKAFIKQIEETDGKYNSFVIPTWDTAIEKAKNVDRKIASGEKPGLLEGIPLAVKSNINNAGVESNCCSKILGGFKPPFSSTAVRRLEDAGMIVLGKTNMDEFAMGSSNEHSAYGIARNPWDIECTPGGSSGGSAIAVSAGMATAALGSETAGSVRQPASLCGVTGLKPTYGRVSRYGLVAFASSLDQIGPITHTAEDMAHVTRVMAGHDRYDSTSSETPVDNYPEMLDKPIKGKKIGIPSEYFGEGLDDEVRKSIGDVLEFYKSEGCEVSEISLPYTEYAIACYYILAPAEASSNLARYDGIRYGYRTDKPLPMRDFYSVTRQEGFGDEVKRRIMLGTYVLSAGYYDAYYKKAQKVRTLIRNDFVEAFKKVDFLITPTSPTTAFKLGEKLDDPLAMYLSDIYTATANLAGIPAISMPSGFDSKGLPIGTQIIGKWFDESGLFNLTHFYQQNTDFHKKKPF